MKYGKKLPSCDYDMNNKPVMPAKSLAPVTRPVPTKAPVGENVIPSNRGGVNAGSVAKVQSASRLPGRLGSSSAHKKLSR